MCCCCPCCPLCCASSAFCGAVFCGVQAFVWTVMAIVGSSAFTDCNIVTSTAKAGEDFMLTWFDMYFRNPNCYSYTYNLTEEYREARKTTELVSSEETYRFMNAYAVLSAFWFVSCISLLIGINRNDDRKKCTVIFYLPFLVMTAAICLLDTIAGVKYGLDIGHVQADISTHNVDDQARWTMMGVSITMCAMFFRGGIFWIGNILIIVFTTLSTFCACLTCSKK